MHDSNSTDRSWRFDVNPHNGTIYRGRLYGVDPDWSGDSWRSYWDGDMMAAVYDHRGYISPTEGEWTDRAEHVVKMCREYDQDLGEALTRLARRLEENWDARFISVSIDRGVTLYALSHGGDPGGEWAREIEALADGDVWRMEVEEWNPHTETWDHADDMFEEWYGEDVAQEAFEKEFPLVELPMLTLPTSTTEEVTQAPTVALDREAVARVIYERTTTNTTAEWDDVGVDTRRRYLNDADAVLALPEVTQAPTVAPDVEAVAGWLWQSGALDRIGEDDATMHQCRLVAETIVAADPRRTEAEVKAEGFEEGVILATVAHRTGQATVSKPGWWPRLT